jgi:hypothetical protein
MGSAVAGSADRSAATALFRRLWLLPLLEEMVWRTGTRHPLFVVVDK